MPSTQSNPDNIERMKSNPKATDEYKAFQSVLRHSLSFTKPEIQQMLADEKKAKEGRPKPGPKPKHATSAHVSDEKD